MRILLTGGLGFIGSRVGSLLLGRHHEIYCLDHRSLLTNLDTRLPKVLQSKMQIVGRYNDIFEQVDGASTVDCVIHLAACVDTKANGDALFQSNLDLTRAVFEFASSLHVPVVFASSGAVYGHGNGVPLNLYGLTKKIGENMLEGTYLPKKTALRFFNVYGSHEHHKGDMASMPFKMARNYHVQNNFNCFNRSAMRDFVFMDDVARAVVFAAEDENFPGGTFDVGTGVAHSFNEIDDILRQGERSLMGDVAIPAELEAKYQNFTQAGSMDKNVLNILDAYGLTNVVSLEEGLKYVQGSC